MPFPVFYRAVFELIDQWSNTVDLDEYLRLSDSIYDAVADAHGKGLWITDDDPVIRVKVEPPRACPLCHCIEVCCPNWFVAYVSTS